jgi:hypothetical protein
MSLDINHVRSVLSSYNSLTWDVVMHDLTQFASHQDIVYFTDDQTLSHKTFASQHHDSLNMQVQHLNSEYENNFV